MRKLVIVTYVLRALGFVLVLLMLFGHSIVLNLFPGLEGHSINPLFYTGIVCYAVGAVIPVVGATVGIVVGGNIVDSPPAVGEGLDV